MSERNGTPFGQSRNTDPQRVRRSALVTDDLLGDGLVLDDETGKIAVNVTGALRVNADGQVELLTDGTTLVQENASPTTLKMRIDPETLGVNAAKGVYTKPVMASKVVNDTSLTGKSVADVLTRINTAIAGKMDDSRALTLTEDPSPGEGVEIIEGPALNYPVMRPKSNAGSTDVPFFIQALGTARVSIDGDYVLHEGEFTTLGGLLVGTGAGTFVELLPTGAGQTLESDPGEPSGLKWVTPAAAVVADGDKGDITVSSTGTVWTIDNDAVTYAKIQDVSATDKLLGRSTAGSGIIEEIACTAAGRALLDDAAASDQRTTLGLGTLATQSGTFSGTSSGTNTGDQTITLTGDVTGSGTGSFAATIANGAVSLAKMANLAQDQFIGRVTASTGVPETATITAAARTVLDDATTGAMLTTLGAAAASHTHAATDITSGTMNEARLGSGTGTATKVLRGDSTWRLVGLTVTFHALSSSQATWSNMPAAATLLNGHHRHVLKVDLTGYTQCRLHLNKMGTAGFAGSKIALQYATTFATTAGSYSTIGTSAVECVFTGTDTYETSSWIDLAAGAKADVFVAVVGSGGDGLVDPQYGAIHAEFR